MHVLQRNDINRMPIKDEKMAKLTAIDFVHETFVAFKEDKAIDCDNNIKNNIKRIQYFSSEYILLFLFTYKQILSDVYLN